MKQERQEREHIRKVIDDTRDRIRELTEKAHKLEYCLNRMTCGCLYLDCVEHGSYDPEDIALVEYHLKFKQ